MRVCVCSTETEWTEWFDRDDERGSGDWEKLSDLHEAYPDRLCSSPLDIQVSLFLHHENMYERVCMITHLTGSKCSHQVTDRELLMLTPGLLSYSSEVT